MYILFILAIIFVILGYLVRFSRTKENDTRVKYLVKSNPMTDTERQFTITIKVITDKYNLIILPQVSLQSILQRTDIKNMTDFNKIKAKTIDFAIVDNNYNYKLFIELDDYTHNRADRIKRDNFINDLFKQYNIKLKRIKVQNNYNLEELESIIKEVV